MILFVFCFLVNTELLELYFVDVSWIYLHKRYILLYGIMVLGALASMTHMLGKLLKELGFWTAEHKALVRDRAVSHKRNSLYFFYHFSLLNSCFKWLLLLLFLALDSFIIILDLVCVTILERIIQFLLRIKQSVTLVCRFFDSQNKSDTPPVI